MSKQQLKMKVADRNTQLRPSNTKLLKKINHTLQCATLEFIPPPSQSQLDRALQQTSSLILRYCSWHSHNQIWPRNFPSVFVSEIKNTYFYLKPLILSQLCSSEFTRKNLWSMYENYKLLSNLRSNLAIQKVQKVDQQGKFKSVKLFQFSVKNF